jgi:hypothetical protein
MDPSLVNPGKTEFFKEFMGWQALRRRNEKNQNFSGREKSSPIKKIGIVES